MPKKMLLLIAALGLIAVGSLTHATPNPAPAEPSVESIVISAADILAGGDIIAVAEKSRILNMRGLTCVITHPHDCYHCCSDWLDECLDGCNRPGCIVGCFEQYTWCETTFCDGLF